MKEQVMCLTFNFLCFATGFSFERTVRLFYAAPSLTLETLAVILRDTANLFYFCHQIITYDFSYNRRTLL